MVIMFFFKMMAKYALPNINHFLVYNAAEWNIFTLLYNYQHYT